MPRKAHRGRPVSRPSLGRTGVDTGDCIVPGARLTGKVERHESFGVFVFLAPGTRADSAERDRCGQGRRPEADVSDRRDVDVVVLEADASGRRIRLSVTAVQKAAEAADVRDYVTREAGAAGASGFGSLADKLRGALDPRDE